MSKLSRLKRCLRLEENRRGRDFVVGDLHGHRDLLAMALARVDFDPARDRVLSVGDLVDRGPQSLQTLALIEEPWFHAVLGNHELMLLSHLGLYESRLHGRKSSAAGSRRWIAEAMRSQRPMLLRLADRLVRLPLMLHVDGPLPFNVMHGDLAPLGGEQDALFMSQTVSVHLAEAAANSRVHIGTVRKGALTPLRFGECAVQVSPTPLGALPLTYVGHSPMPQVTVHGSYIYIDQGLCTGKMRTTGPRLPTLLEHRGFGHWIRGVARARETAAEDGAAADWPARVPEAAHRVGRAGAGRAGAGF